MKQKGTLINGEALEVLRTIESDSMDCCVTSPPYWRLRDYFHPKQIGMEGSIDDYIQKLVEVFDELKRVLSPAGTVFLNLGDTYITWSSPIKGLARKNIAGVPWKVAFALQQAGWILRQDIVWHKPNPQPESVKDRCTRSHEYVFLLTKSQRYFFNHQAIAEPTVTRDLVIRDRKNSKINNTPFKKRTEWLRSNNYSRKNKRDVWTISNPGIKEPHFSAFPIELPTICIKAGCPEGGSVIDPFAGSGSTLIAAQKLGRSFVGIELDEESYEIASMRIQADGGLFSPELREIRVAAGGVA